MSKTIIVSNRLPISVKFNNDELIIEQSIGGLATGMRSFHSEKQSIWIGWNGICIDTIEPAQYENLVTRLYDEHQYISVPLTTQEMEGYYYGFSNSTIWPLFHYFPYIAKYEPSMYLAYKKANEKFADIVAQHTKKGDIVWVHDYQLLLLPEMLRPSFPNNLIGFFLHIPFPSYELFRLLPWRTQILNGMLAADLCGFHTYDYVRHFQSSVRRLLRLEYDNKQLYVGNRSMHADAFPMGIDYHRFYHSVETDTARDKIAEIYRRTKGTQVVLSVDRLDYTKGILQRITAYHTFLTANPEYKERVVMIMIVAPSRVEVDSYKGLLDEIRILVSKTNGELGTIGWTPIWFFHRTFNFDDLTALYRRAEVLLVTPLRDGMNLISKEYIATRADMEGVLVMSETIGAASELSEALLVNPNDINQIALGLKQALEMPKNEQIKRNTFMHERVKRYNVKFWAQDFMQHLESIRENQQGFFAQKITPSILKKIISEYHTAKERFLFLDYDGTLVPFTDKPPDAMPDTELKEMLKMLSETHGEVIIISGRDHDVLEEWFGDLSIDLIASHGLWFKKIGADWKRLYDIDDQWKKEIMPVLQLHTDRTPGSLIEEKTFSLAWHYRSCDPDLSQVRLSELREILLDMTQNSDLGLLEGKKVLEIKHSMINKGKAIQKYLQKRESDFVLCAGDDWTDEMMFQNLSKKAYTIKVGSRKSHARFSVEGPQQMREILQQLLQK